MEIDWHCRDFSVTVPDVIYCVHYFAFYLIICYPLNWEHLIPQEISIITLYNFTSITMMSIDIHKLSHGIEITPVLSKLIWLNGEKKSN